MRKLFMIILPALLIALQNILGQKIRKTSFLDRAELQIYSMISSSANTSTLLNNRESYSPSFAPSIKPAQEQDSILKRNENHIMRQHFVFIGDSTLRYSYLQLLDDEYHQFNMSRIAPKKLIHEKYHPNWTSFFKYTTNYFKGHMTCDCQRSENWNLGTEIENRQYTSPHTGDRYTYIQLYGDNQAHGRYEAKEMDQAEITLPPDANVTADYKEKQKIWGYMGQDLDQLILKYVKELVPKPTVLILNAGLWPNSRIASNMDNIISAACDKLGVGVIWRATVKHRDNKAADPSEADRVAKDFAYRRGSESFHYHPFPSLNLTEEDYFDGLHFSQASVYRNWNQDLRTALENRDQPPKNMVFILTGAIRTLEHTYPSLLSNWIRPLCSPPNCVAHLVTHFSYTDNRPSRNNDPNGVEVKFDFGIKDANTFFTNSTFFRHYTAPEYNIASEAEQKAMLTVEKEPKDESIRARMKLFRIGDPRRYSMWFSRAWTWRFVKQLRKMYLLDFDMYIFGRPDLLWFHPSPTYTFFHDYSISAHDAWFHDTYYSDLPDTFAYFKSKHAAETYFSIENLVKPGIACLGGPSFNSTLVKTRLKNANITTVSSDWCEVEAMGWSEQILGRKIRESNVTIRYLPTGTAILRPPHQIDCQSLQPKFLSGWAKHYASMLPFLQCKLIDYQVEKSSMVNDLFNVQNLFRFRHVEDSGTCLSHGFNGTFVAEACDELHNYAYWQIYAAGDKKMIFKYENITGSVFPVNLSDIDLNKWRKEILYMYSSNTLNERSFDIA